MLDAPYRGISWRWTNRPAITNREQDSEAPAAQLIFHVAEEGLLGLAKNLRSRFGYLRAFGLRYRTCQVASSLGGDTAQQLDELWSRCIKHDASDATESWRATSVEPAARNELVYFLRCSHHLDAVMVARYEPAESAIVDYCGPANDSDLMAELAAHVVADLTRRGTVRIRAMTSHPQMIEALEYVGLVRSSVTPPSACVV